MYREYQRDADTYIHSFIGALWRKLGNAATVISETMRSARQSFSLRPWDFFRVHEAWTLHHNLVNSLKTAEDMRSYTLPGEVNQCSPNRIGVKSITQKPLKSQLGMSGISWWRCNLPWAQFQRKVHFGGCWEGGYTIFVLFITLHFEHRLAQQWQEHKNFGKYCFLLQWLDFERSWYQ